MTPGSKLGPYEVVGLIGAGGMGEVHRARDTRLGRDVAIKTLPPGLAASGERLRRFELEARAASLLSHPNILTVYDVGTSDGQPYIVSELLEGENLRERLTRGPLPSSKSLEIAASVADGLAAAHARGIIHRDLKPENIFLTQDGRLKILDFGIAKLTTPESSEPGSAATVTILTDAGVAVGTLGYMAPEQVRGEPADPRADIFAIGAVLYEMLASAPAFRRDSRVQTVNAVLESDPTPLPDSLAPAFRLIVRRCLEKAAGERFQTAQDLAFALRTLGGTIPASPANPAMGAQRARWWPIAAAAVASAAITIAAVWALSPTPSIEPRMTRRLSFQPAVPIATVGIAISPDGSRVVYSAVSGSSLQLYERDLGQLQARPLAGTEGGRVPFFSPDGQWIAFAAAGKLRKIPAAGGAALALCDIDVVLAGTWTDDGTIVISQRERGLLRVPAEGGTLEPLMSPEKGAGEIDHHAPHALPGGALLFTVHTGSEAFRVAVRSASGEQRTLIEDAFFARYVPSGHIVYGRADGLFAAPFDVRRLVLTGPAVLVVEDVARAPGDGTIEFAAAADGTLAYVPALGRDGRTLVWVDRTGKTETLPTPPRSYERPALSPDGKRLAVQIGDGSRRHIWMYDFASGALTRLSSEGDESAPIWGPDGRHVTYTARRNGERHIVTQPIDANAEPASLLTSRNDLWAAGWTRDGSRLIYAEDPPTSLGDIKALRPGQSMPEPVAAGPGNELQPDLSPDGQWLAYVMFEGGRPQIFVRPLAGGSARPITPDGGMQPRWSPTGREIFFRRLDAVMTIPLQTTPGLVVGKTERLFDDTYVFVPTGSPDYDVSADGRRLLMVKPAETERLSPPINIVTNWFGELERRVPVER